MLRTASAPKRLLSSESTVYRMKTIVFIPPPEPLAVSARALKKRRTVELATSE
jgi:hypothetical protein